MASLQHLSQWLAEAFLAGEWSTAALAARGADALGLPAPPPWLRAIAGRVARRFKDGPPDHADALLPIFLRDRGLARARREASPPLSIHRYLPATPAMRPRPGAPSTWSVPSLATTFDLAAWLGLGVDELRWFAGTEGRAGRTEAGALAHYTYRWAPKSTGALRLLEAPKARLKALQRELLHGILDHVPAHEAAHGFCKGRSARSFAAPHAAKAMLLKVDLREFFATVRASRVFALFRTMGYPDEVARLLTGLVTHAAPPGELSRAPLSRTRGEVEERFRARQLYRTPHLPQGAPTSPTLANLCAFRLDVRLSAAARAAGATYTRYADDLAFSGGDAFARGATRFYALVCGIAAEEGFCVQGRKTRFLRPGVRQRVAGVVVNAHPNVARAEVDRLKAILHNAARFGAASQNREGRADFRAYLEGKVAWVLGVNPERGQRLREALRRIEWEDTLGRKPDPE